MLPLEATDGCVQGIAKEAVKGAGVIIASSQDRLQHSDICAGHGLVDHGTRKITWAISEKIMGYFQANYSSGLALTFCCAKTP